MADCLVLFPMFDNRKPAFLSKLFKFMVRKIAPQIQFKKKIVAVLAFCIGSPPPHGFDNGILQNIYRLNCGTAVRSGTLRINANPNRIGQVRGATLIEIHNKESTCYEGKTFPLFFFVAFPAPLGTAYFNTQRLKVHSKHSLKWILTLSAAT